MATKKTNSGQSEETKPLMVYETSATSTTRSRRNAGSSIERTDRFKNINDGLVPFKYGGTSYGKHSSSLNVRDAVLLCQKAYYNYPSFRNVIDLMTEFSVGNVYFKGGSKKSREFFEALFKKINLWSIQEKFFREYYRSGNVFVYRFAAILQSEDVKKISRLFGASVSLIKKNAVPARYVFLNPADIEMSGTLSFHSGVYFKTLSDFELERLRSPRTEEDQEVFNSLDSETKEAIKIPVKIRYNRSCVLEC